MEINSNNKKDFFKKKVIISALLSFIDIAIIALIFFFSISKFTLQRSEKTPVYNIKTTNSTSTIKDVVKESLNKSLIVYKDKKMEINNKYIHLSELATELKKLKLVKITIKKDKNISMSFITKIVTEIKSVGIKDIVVENI